MFLNIFSGQISQNQKKKKIEVFKKVFELYQVSKLLDIHKDS